MSQQLINRSLDLKRLRDEGYDVEIRSNHLLIKSVPYVNSSKEINRGMLVSELTLAGDVTTRPSTHVVSFAGDHPCNKDGAEITKIKHQSATQQLGPHLEVHHSFSSKPAEGYSNYYEMMTTYASIISHHAQAIDPTATPKTFPAIVCDEDESVFHYLDTASSRAGINAVTIKLEHERIGIVGLGGTGSYILDLVAKTPVKEIHIIDGDTFSQHNAFRSPGAPSIEELQSELRKVEYLKRQYSKMHRNIVAHDCYIDASNVMLLEEMDFVFLSLDKGEIKKVVVKKLEELRIPFIDVGIGVEVVDGALIGVLRVTTSTVECRDHVTSKNRIPFTDGDGNDAYSHNIQIADLNALNAALAVIKWKKLCGFYCDLENEHFSTYTIDGNAVINEDHQ